MPQHAAALRAHIGQDLGHSHWVTIDQAKIDAFADLVGDTGWIHTDPERAARETPFGGTIVQGFMLLSHFTQFAKSLELPVSDVAYRMNYGFDRIRVIRPVPVNSRIRGRFQLKDVRDKGDDAIVATLETHVEIDGQPEPAVVAEWLTYIRFAG